jgi:hypothetical protein
MFDAYFKSDIGRNAGYVINNAISDYAISALYPKAVSSRPRKEEW